jgi:PAS domain S-box-containing protein
MNAHGAPKPKHLPPGTPSLGATVGTYALVALTTIGIGVVGYRSAAGIVVDDRLQELQAVAAFKADQVVRWRAERLADAVTLAADPLLTSALLGERGSSAAAAEELEEWFAGLRATGDYLLVALTDPNGTVRIRAGAPIDDPELVRSLAKRAIGGGESFASDFRWGPGGSSIDFVAPFPGGPGRAAGAVIVRSDPEPYLFRAVGSWHRPSESAEGLLVQRDGDGAEVLNLPRGRQPAPRALWVPSTAGETPSLRAVGGKHGAAVSRDHRGVEVLAASVAVPGTPWSIVVKERLDEVLAPLEERRVWTVLAVVAFLAVSAVATAAWWRTRIQRAEQARLLVEVERSAQARKIERLTRFAHDMVFLADDQQRFLEVNDRAMALLGYSREELLGMRVVELRDAATASDYEARVQEQVAAGGARFETVYRRKDGTPLPVEVSVHTEEIDGHRYFHGIARDIGDRKRLEAQLVLTARLASVGTLAGGVAHEVNNPLAFILSNLEYALAALRKGGGDPELIRALEDARDGGQRIRDIVQGLQSFARRSDVQETLDLREVVEATVNMARNELRHHAHLVLDVRPAPRVRASAHGLGQAFLNLLVNAAQAIPEGHATENEVRVRILTGADGRAVVEISDTGVGIAPEILPRIFDPFFTTRPIGAGAGLGLSMCHGIVADAGGEISVDSTPGKGTTFRVSLPPAPPEAEEPAAATPVAAPVAQRRGRILVVDDEPLVGAAIARLLSTEHEVATRTSAREALDELLAGTTYDAILCDLMMPNMTGMELHARLAERSPADARRMIFLTGGAFSTAAQDFIERTGIEPLEKPIDLALLRARVAAVLANA